MPLAPTPPKGRPSMPKWTRVSLTVTPPARVLRRIRSTLARSSLKGYSASGRSRRLTSSIAASSEATRQDRAEDLLAHHPGLVAGLEHQVRREQPLPRVVPGRQRHHLQAARAGIVQVRLQAGEGGVVDDPAVVVRRAGPAVAGADL